MPSANDFVATFGTGGSLAILVFTIGLAISWLLMPFAIIGTKPILLDKLEVECEILEQLKLIRAVLADIKKGQTPDQPDGPALKVER